MIRINDQRYWLYAGFNPETNELLHVQLFSTTTTALTEIFLREFRAKHDVDDALFLVDATPHLKSTLHRVGLRFQLDRHGNRNSLKCVFREGRRRTSSFLNCFNQLQPATAETWLRAFAVWWNSLS